LRESAPLTEQLRE